MRAITAEVDLYGSRRYAAAAGAAHQVEGWWDLLTRWITLMMSIEVSAIFLIPFHFHFFLVFSLSFPSHLFSFAFIPFLSFSVLLSSFPLPWLFSSILTIFFNCSHSHSYPSIPSLHSPTAIVLSLPSSSPLSSTFLLHWQDCCPFSLPGRQPISVDEFANLVRRMHTDGDIGFSEEYEVSFPFWMLLTLENCRTSHWLHDYFWLENHLTNNHFNLMKSIELVMTLRRSPLTIVTRVSRYN